jgi:predicted esterase
VRISASALFLAAGLLCPGMARGQAKPPAQEIKHPWHGDFKDDYKDPKTQAHIMHYRMWAPEKQPEQKHLGLIVWFHGMGGNEDGVGVSIDGARRVKLQDEYVIMGGKSKGAGWAPADDENVLKWIAWVKETYPIDPRRVHIMGHSNGGAMSERFGWEHQDLFASSSPYAGAGGQVFSATPKGVKLGKPGAPDGPAETKMEWYLVHGDKDAAVSVDTSRRACKDLRDKGYRYVYREIAGADHGSIFQFTDVIDDNIRFIHALRHKEIPVTKDERAELASLSAKAKAEKPETAGAMLAELERIGGPPAEKVLKNAIENADPEVKKAALAVTQKTFFGKDMVLELIKLLKDKSDDIKAESFKSLAVAANWRYPEAQEILEQVARKKTAPVEERIHAIHGLGQAVKLDLLGNFEDKLVIWTLVLLLDDDELKIREAAFAPLEKGVKDTFGYAPDLGAPERKASAAKWKTWCEQKAGPLNGPGPAGKS